MAFVGLRSSGTATHPRVQVGRVSSIDARALTLATHTRRGTHPCSPPRTGARGPCGTRHIHA
eukprot:5867345-Prymnesium_polylepis.1